MTVRPWEYKDIIEIERLERQSFSDAWSYKMLADSFMEKNFYGILAEEKGDIVGCASVLFGYGDADLLHVVVAVNERRKGFGENLLKAVFNECVEKGVAKLFLEVRKSNEPAIKLYSKHGFKKISERAKYYEDGETALVMLKEFSYK